MSYWGIPWKSTLFNYYPSNLIARLLEPSNISVLLIKLGLDLHLHFNQAQKKLTISRLQKILELLLRLHCLLLWEHSQAQLSENRVTRVDVQKMTINEASDRK